MKPRADVLYQPVKGTNRFINGKKGVRYLTDDTAVTNADGLRKFKEWLNS